MEPFVQQHHLVSVVLFFLSLMIHLTREGILLSQVLSWPVDEGEIKSGQKERPTCLPTVQVLGCTEVCEVPMVVQDLYHVFGSL